MPGYNLSKEYYREEDISDDELWAVFTSFFFSSK